MTKILAWDDFSLSTYEEDIYEGRRKVKIEIKDISSSNEELGLIRSLKRNSSKQTKPINNPNKKGEKHTKKETSAKKCKHKE